MTIVITDGFTLNPGDLSWTEIENFGAIQYHDRLAPERVAEKCRDANIIVVNKTPINAHTIAAASHLQLIAVTATGYNIVDLEAANKRKIPVCNVPAYGTDSVAQHCFALIFELTNHVGLHEQSVRNGEWSKSRDFSLVKSPVIELAGKTLGIVGLGRIGRKVAKIALAMDIRVIFHDPGKQLEGSQSCDLDSLFRESDFISLHCPLKPENQGFVNADRLSQMKPSAYLINTSRGALINEADLADALKKNKIAGAALDVLAKEPPVSDHPLVGLSNCIITPHIAWVSFEARQRIMQTTVENIQKFLHGKPQHVVNAGF